MSMTHRYPQPPLPQPFDWITIPGGAVTVRGDRMGMGYIPDGKTKTFDVPTFVIGKYPITVGQYAEFIDDGGYDDRRWWIASGWDYKEKGRWKAPLHGEKQLGEPDIPDTPAYEFSWIERLSIRFDVMIGRLFTNVTDPKPKSEPKVPRSTNPVVGVSWFEAVAFCLWLGTIRNAPCMLPTEQQWQRAAQGDTGYEGSSDSPYGGVDMGGKLWEWCLTNYTYGHQHLRQYDRSLDDFDDDTYDPMMRSNNFVRRGAWYHDPDSSLTTTGRGFSAPYKREWDYGFRVAYTAQ